MRVIECHPRTPHDSVPRHCPPVTYRVVVLAFSIMAHVFAIVHVLSRFSRLGLPQQFLAQFVLLSVISAIGATIIPVCRRTVWTMSVMAVQAACLLVATWPLEDELVVKAVLYGSFLAQCSLLPRSRLGTTVAAVFVSVALLTQSEVRAWDRIVAAPDIGTWIGFGLLLTGIAVFSIHTGSILRRIHANVLDLERLQKRAASLVNANVNLQQSSLDLQVRAASDERKRVTRDIHDTVCYAFSCIIMMMNDATIAASRDDMELVRHLHSRAIDLARESLSDTRVSLRLFRELERYDQPLSAILKRLTDSFQYATETRVRVHFTDFPADLSPRVKETIQRLVQEAMANSVRHGNPELIEVLFGRTDTEFAVCVRDDGGKVGPVIEGIGLSGMRERVEAAGGIFMAQASALGFSVNARFPLTPSVME